MHRGNLLSVSKMGVSKWAILSVVLLIVGLIFGYGLAVLSGPLVTTTITQSTTLTMTTTHLTTEIHLTTIQATKTHFITSTETLTKTVTTTLTTEIKPMACETYSLKILEVIVDRVSMIDYDYYIFTLEASYRGGRTWDFIVLNLYLVSDKGYKYSISYSLAERQLLQSGELKDGESIKGQVSFKLPKDEVPLRLIYEDKLKDIRLEVMDVPPPSRQVSWIFFAETKVQSEYSIIWASASIKTPGTAFYSGEKIEVELSIKYSRIVGSPAIITITSITVDMFEIVETDPKLPITLKDGEEVVVKIILRVPEEGYKGNLKITIYA